MSTHELVDAGKAFLPVNAVCELLDVPRSSYQEPYAWCAERSDMQYSQTRPRPPPYRGLTRYNEVCGDVGLAMSNSGIRTGEPSEGMPAFSLSFVRRDDRRLLGLGWLIQGSPLRAGAQLLLGECWTRVR